MKKYQVPEFLASTVSQDGYEKWLHRRAMAHVRRDRKRGCTTVGNEEYKLAIHKAVRDSNGRDAYTGERLDWKLISKYDNKDSKRAGSEYKKRFALLPTVDHVGRGKGRTKFAICAWRTNDSKNDLPYKELLRLCQKVVSAANKRRQARHRKNPGRLR
jgi:hypothetical protein